MKKESIKIGIISPSSSIVGEENIETFKEGVKMLELAGFEVILGKNIYSVTEGGYCGSTKEKLEDLYFVTQKAKNVICSSGGINANILLDKIDYERIKDNVFIGNSNPVLLFNAFYEMKKIKSYIGPNVKTLGKLSNDFSIKCLKAVLLDNDYKICTEENIIPINVGTAEGIAIGGNIQSLRRIVGTQYFPKLSNYILYLEANFKETNFTEYESILEQFKQAGIIDKANGIVLGFYDNNIEFYKKMFIDYKKPIIICNNLGHGVNNNMLPIGSKISISETEIKKL